MAISGKIVMEDIVIFYCNRPDNMVEYTVEEWANPMRSETFTVPQDKFFKALAIAIHNDGMPDYIKDYPDAESIQGDIRWIP